MGKISWKSLGIGVSIFWIYVSSGYLLFTWNNMLGYYLLVLLASLLCGMLIIEYETALKIILVTFIAGVIVFIWFTTLPALLFGENFAGEINMVVTLFSTEYSRVIIISFPASIFACLFGCFLGRSLESE